MDYFIAKGNVCDLEKSVSLHILKAFRWLCNNRLSARLIHQSDNRLLHGQPPDRTCAIESSLHINWYIPDMQCRHFNVPKATYVEIVWQAYRVFCM